MLIQLYGIAATIAWSALATFVLLKAIGLIVPLRASKESEIDGLDLTQHGEALQSTRVGRLSGTSVSAHGNKRAGLASAA